MAQFSFEFNQNCAQYIKAPLCVTIRALYLSYRPVWMSEMGEGTHPCCRYCGRVCRGDFRANQCVWTEGLQRRAATAAHSQLEHAHPRTHACCQPAAPSLPSLSPPFFHADRTEKERILMEVSSELSEVLAMVREIDRERRLLWQLMKRLLSFPIYSQWRNAYLLHTSPFFHLICMQIKHPMQMGQAGEEGGFQTCCASSFQSVIHDAHGGVHLNPRVNGNPAAVPQSAPRRSPRRTGDDRRSCCQSLH